MNIKINNIRCYCNMGYYNQTDFTEEFINISSTHLKIDNKTCSLIYRPYSPMNYNIYIVFNINKSNKILINKNINSLLNNNKNIKYYPYLDSDKKKYIFIPTFSDGTSFNVVTIDSSRSLVSMNYNNRLILYTNNLDYNSLNISLAYDDTNDFKVLLTDDELDNRTYNNFSIINTHFNDSMIIRNEYKNNIILFNFAKITGNNPDINFNIPQDYISLSSINNIVSQFFNNSNLSLNNIILDNTALFTVNDSKIPVLKIIPTSYNMFRSARISSKNTNILTLTDFTNCSDLSFININNQFIATLYDTTNEDFAFVKVIKRDNTSVILENKIQFEYDYIFFPVVIGYIKQFVYNKMYNDLNYISDLIESISIYFDFS